VLTGSLCSGYLGLDLAVHEVLGGELAWVADNDPDKSAILAHRFPGVPNLGDISETDWSAVEPVDVLTAGFPCTDISCAGRRAGLRKGNRSGVWHFVARAIAELRPPLVVIENVKELLSERADSDMEPCPWCLGDTSAESAMRALGAVLADLAEIGFDAEWTSLPAAGAGACHLRWRVFVLAWPAADAGRGRFQEHAERDGRPLAGFDGALRDDALRCGAAPADPAGIGEREPADEADALAGSRRPRAVPGGGSARAAADDGGGLSSDPGIERLEVRAVEHHGPERPATERGGRDVPWWADDAAWRRPGAFGRYEAAVRQHERVFGRLAPAPVEPAKNGNPRLSPRFSEWMMGLPDGWVTGVPGLSRNAQLKAIGDGVMPAQAAMALRMLLERAGIPSLVAEGDAA